MRLPLLTLLLSAAASLLKDTANAFPTGAGGCSGDGAAVGGAHLDGSKTITSGSLEDGGFSVLLDGMQLETNEDFAIELDTDVVLTLIATGGTPFKGVLMRVEANNVDIQDAAALTPTDNVQNAGVCQAPVGGVTHFNNDDKTTASATLRFETATSISLDVTVVVANDDSDSIFYYQGFSGAAAGDSSTGGGGDEGDDAAATTDPTQAPVANDGGTATDDAASATMEPTMPPSMGASTNAPSLAGTTSFMPTMPANSTAPSDMPSSAPSVPPGTPTMIPTIALETDPPTMEPSAVAGATFEPTTTMPPAMNTDRDSAASVRSWTSSSMVVAVGLVQWLV